MFASGDVSGAIKQFSKAIWMCESGKVKDVPTDMRSVFHSNRAFAYIKQKQWTEADADCTKALVLNAANIKANYRRAMARVELQQYEGALADVELVLKGAPQSEAQQLKERIQREMKARPA